MEGKNEIFSEMYKGLKDGDIAGKYKRLYKSLQGSGIEVVHMIPMSTLINATREDMEDILHDLEKMYASLI